MSTASWFYASGEEQVGPFSAVDMVRYYDLSELPGETYVWREGLSDWVPLSHVIGELRASSMTAPVPAPPPPPPTLSASSAASPYAPPDSFLAGSSSLAPAVASGPGGSPYGPYKSPSTRATVVVVMLSMSIFVSLVTAVSSFMQLLLLNDVASGAYDGRQDHYLELANANDLRVELINWAYRLIFVGCVVSWCMWTHRVMRNAWSFAHRYRWLETTPGWAVGWFFIPIAHLWKPFGALSQAWRATVDPDKGDRLSVPGIMVVWWTTWVITNILSNIKLRLGPVLGTEIDALLTVTKMDIADELIGIALTPFAIMVVVKLTKMQRERHEQALA